MVESYKGLGLDHWCPIQTLKPRPEGRSGQWYAGYDLLSNEWFDFIEIDIPLDIRFSNFTKRLKAATERKLGKINVSVAPLPTNMP